MPDERRKDYPNLLERVAILEAQVVRLVSDAESEKGTRRRMNEFFDGKLTLLDDRQRKMERTMWQASGAVSVIVSLVVIVVNILAKHL